MQNINNKRQKKNQSDDSKRSHLQKDGYDLWGANILGERERGGKMSARTEKGCRLIQNVLIKKLRRIKGKKKICASQCT